MDKAWVQVVPAFFWASVGVIAFFGLLMPKRLVWLLSFHSVELPYWGTIVVRCVALFFVFAVVALFWAGSAFQTVP